MRRILVADDEPDIVNILAIFLEANGFQVLKANDGAQALERACTELPDLILLDVMMPELSGYQVVSRLKSEPTTREIPVVMLSAKPHHDGDFRADEPQASAYVLKPFDLHHLLSQIRSLLKG